MKLAITPDANGDLRRSAIKQVAVGSLWRHHKLSLINAVDLQIKISAGRQNLGKAGSCRATKWMK